MLSRLLRRYGPFIALLSFLLSFFSEAPADWVPGDAYGELRHIGQR